jgi:ribosomal protein L17
MNQPKFEGIDSVYKSKADNKDIRDLLEKLVPKAKGQMAEFSKQFKGKTDEQTCRNIFNYLMNNFTYLADGEEQIIKLPSALLKKKIGDCKSYALFTASILENLGIPYSLIYTSYNSNPIPQHVYVITQKGCIIDAVYGKFNQEKPPIYKYKKDMNVRYMAGIGCDCDNSGMGAFTIISKEKRDQFKNFTKEQLAEAEANAKRLRDKAEAEAKAARDKALKAAKDAQASIEAKAKQARDKALELANKFPQGLKTGGLSGGRALFLLMIQNNLDGFASKLSQGNTTALLDSWYRLGGDRTKLANALKKGASKPEKKLGFLPKLNKIYDKAGINGIGAIDPNEKPNTFVAAPKTDSEAKQQANAAINQYKMDGNIQTLIGTLCTAAGTAIGGAVGAAGGLTAAATATIGTVSGAALGTIVIGLTPVIVNAVRKTPKTDNADNPLTPPAIDPTSAEEFEKEFNKPKPLPTDKNTMLYVGGGALLLAGIYFATKK